MTLFGFFIAVFGDYRSVSNIILNYFDIVAFKLSIFTSKNWNASTISFNPAPRAIKLFEVLKSSRTLRGFRPLNHHHNAQDII